MYDMRSSVKDRMKRVLTRGMSTGAVIDGRRVLTRRRTASALKIQCHAAYNSSKVIGEESCLSATNYG